MKTMDHDYDQNIIKITGMGLRVEKCIEKRLSQFDTRDYMTVLNIEMTYTLFGLPGSPTDFLFFLAVLMYILN